jgi:hypothetical protein
MDKLLATRIARALLECSGTVDTSVAWVKAECSEDDLQRYRKAAGRVMGAIYFEILEPIFEEYPDLQPDGMKQDVG